MRVLNVGVETPESRVRWAGISPDQSGNTWMRAGRLSPFQCVSGAADWGTDVDDEAKIVGTEDTPIIAGNKRYRMCKILIVDASVETEYIIRVIYGSTTRAALIAANQYTEFMFKFDASNPTESPGVPVELTSPIVPVATTKLWVECKNATDNATIDFYVCLREFDT